MGGFFLAKVEGEGRRLGAEFASERARARFASALAVFKERGQSITREGVAHGFYFALFSKADGTAPVVVESATGELTWMTGTPLRVGRLASSSLESLLASASALADTGDLTGSYILVRLGPSGLEIATDHGGSSPVYVAESGVFSSSFLAASESLPERTIDPQGFYEYVLTGAQYGEGTYLREVKRLDSSRVHRTLPGGQSDSSPKSPSITPSILPRDLVESALDRLRAYFGALIEVSDGSIAMGLTAGFDSRLMLAALLERGVRPMLMVRGKKEDTDVRVALGIAEHFRYDIYHSNEAVRPIAQGKLRDVVGARVARTDGLSPSGSLGLKERKEGPSTSEERAFIEKRLVLNGGGGEIFRDYWELPDSALDVRRLVRHGIEWKIDANLRHMTGPFDAEKFFETLAEKMQACVAAKERILSRHQISLAYPYFRVRHWTTATLQAHQPIRYALLPFTDAALIDLACAIPAPSRYEGAFEAELIRRLSPELARLPSGYGESFEHGPSLRRRVIGMARRKAYHLPPAALLNVRNWFEGKGGRAQQRAGNVWNGSAYLALFGDEALPIDELFNWRSCPDSAAANRALTVQYVVRGIAR